jgi:hypothetical protein
MAKTQSTSVGLGGSLKPRLIKEKKKSKVYSFTTKKFGRFAYTRDPGEASLFMTQMLSTRLGAILRGPDYSIRGQMHRGPILDEFDLGSGKVTNMGVSALANDFAWETEAAEPINTLNVCKYMSWGTGTGEGEVFNWKLETEAENEASKKEAVVASTRKLTFIAAGNAKLVITATLEANLAGPTAITEWGLFSAAKTAGEAQKAATGTSAITLTDTAKLVKPGETASAAKTRGAQNYIVWAKEKGAAENEDLIGLITKNTSEVATVPAWEKGASAGGPTTPYEKTKYTIYPLMWDRRKFAAINVEKGNKIEFPYELEIKSGG